MDSSMLSTNSAYFNKFPVKEHQLSLIYVSLDKGQLQKSRQQCRHVIHGLIPFQILKCKKFVLNYLLPIKKFNIFQRMCELHFL